MLGQFVASGARRCLIAVSRLAFVRMVLPHFRFRCVTTPTSLTGCFVVNTGVLDAGGHCRRLAANEPEEGKQCENADCDREKIDVFSIHKAERTVAPRVSRLKSRI